jgi:hypothetical protein
VEYVTLGPAPHTHVCPDCEKKVPHDGRDCEEFAAKFFHDFPCRKARMKRMEAPAGTCLHCGEMDLSPSDMEPLSDGGPSNMCKSCGDQLRGSDLEYAKDQITRWIEQARKSEQTARERDTWKRMSKSERKAAMAGEASGSLF